MRQQEVHSKAVNRMGIGSGYQGQTNRTNIKDRQTGRTESIQPGPSRPFERKGHVQIKSQLLGRQTNDLALVHRRALYRVSETAGLDCHTLKSTKTDLRLPLHNMISLMGALGARGLVSSYSCLTSSVCHGCCCCC
jgi:hypothetical protein